MKPNRDSMAEHRRGHTRLAILRALMRLPDLSSNLLVMADYLKDLALTVGQDVLRQDLQILQELNCVELSDVRGLTCVRLTHYGLEVAEGLHTLEPILHPGPDCPY